MSAPPRTGTKPNPNTTMNIVPCLWFDTEAEEAARYYTSIIRNSKITDISHYSDAGTDVHGKKAGSVLMVCFELDGRPFTALNGGPDFKFTEAVSFQIMCDTQEELDEYWDKLGRGGDPECQVCGWLKDKYGLSWQLVPSIVPELLRDPVTEKTGRVMAAIMGMKKIDIATLLRVSQE